MIREDMAYKRDAGNLAEMKTHETGELERMDEGSLEEMKLVA